MARILRSCLQQLVQAIYFHASHNVSWKSFRTGLDVSPSVRGSPSSRPPVKWKNGKDGKYNDTRDARARALVHVYKCGGSFHRTGRPRGSGRKAASVLELGEQARRKKEKRIILFFPFPPCFCFCSSPSSSRAEESFFLLLLSESLDQNLFTHRGGNSPRTSAHLWKYPYFSTPKCTFTFFLFLRSRAK